MTETPQSKGGLARAASLTGAQRSAIASGAALARWHGASPTQSVKIAVRQIEKHKAAIARHRDALREIMEDLDAVVDSIDDAYQSLDYAVQRLSEFM